MPSEQELHDQMTNAEEALRLIRLRLHPTIERAREIYDEWSPMKGWLIEEAAVIGIGLDPGHLDLIQYMNEEDAAKFHKLRKHLIREFEESRVPPPEFVSWGRRNERVVDRAVISEIEKRLRKPERKVDASRKDMTLLKMVLAMAIGKYKYLNGNTSPSSVAKSIIEDFDSLESGVSLSKGAILQALQRAIDEDDNIKAAIDRRKTMSGVLNK